MTPEGLGWFLGIAIFIILTIAEILSPPTPKKKGRGHGR